MPDRSSFTIIDGSFGFIQSQSFAMQEKMLIWKNKIHDVRTTIFNFYMNIKKGLHGMFDDNLFFRT